MRVEEAIAPPLLYQWEAIASSIELPILMTPCFKPLQTLYASSFGAI